MCTQWGERQVAIAMTNETESIQQLALVKSIYYSWIERDDPLI